MRSACLLMRQNGVVCKTHSVLFLYTFYIVHLNQCAYFIMLTPSLPPALLHVYRKLYSLILFYSCTFFCCSSLFLSLHKNMHRLLSGEWMCNVHCTNCRSKTKIAIEKNTNCINIISVCLRFFFCFCFLSSMNFKEFEIVSLHDFYLSFSAVWKQILITVRFKLELLYIVKAVSLTF